jgi:2,3-dimethylmalate lyase
VIIARTDARAPEGLERALQRGRLYREAGADVLFIEALTSEAEAEAAVRAFPGVPLLFNWAEGGKTPPISLQRVTELGYRIVIFPISTLLAATAAMRRILQEIAQAGTPAAAMHELPTFAEFVDFIGLPQVREAEQRYAVTDAAPRSGSAWPPTAGTTSSRTIRRWPWAPLPGSTA